MRSYYSYMVFTFITMFVFSSCGKKEETKTPPSVDITAPAENSEFAKNTQIEFNIESINGYGTQMLKSIDHYIDDIKIDQDNTLAGKCFWQSTRENIGEHTFKVIVTAFNDLQDEDELIFSITGPYEDYRSKYLGEFDFTSILEVIRTMESDSGYYSLNTYDTTYYTGVIREFYQSDYTEYYTSNFQHNISIIFKEDMITYTEIENDGTLNEFLISETWWFRNATFNGLDSLNFELILIGGHHPGYNYYVSGTRH